MSIQTINPFNNQVVKTFEEMKHEAIDAAVNKAEKCFETWRKNTYKERTALLHKVATLMRSKKDHLAKLITLEMGKLFVQSQGEIALSADIVDYYATHGEQFLANIKLKPEHGEAYIKNSPVGVLLGVEPWNFPFYQVARFAAP